MSDAPAQKTSSPSGWHSRGYLPHFDAPELVQTVVFRLADSLPRRLRVDHNGQKITFDDHDDTLDAGKGECWLRRPEIATLAEEVPLHFDGERYFLLGWCVMPNHIHAMLEMRSGFRLGAQIKSGETFSGRRANGVLGRTGALRSADYFDRFIRNERHFGAALAYIEANPVKAGVVDDSRQWRWSSARRRDV